MEVKEKIVNSVYIHIPFCKNICSYCSFCKFYYNESMVSNYLEALEKEIISNYNNDRISTIYIGGGTPSDLSMESLERLLEITKIFFLDDNYEFTFECNINVDSEKLLLLKKYGVNRLSFGIESIDHNNLNIIDRHHTKDEIKKKINYCRKIGFSNINGDLIYAFKDEDMDTLKKDIEFLLELDLEHISTYSLIIEEHTKLYLKGYMNCDEELDAMMYEYIHNLLKENGYIHYEVSNFGKEGYFSKHNMVYWNNDYYYGFGLSASGYLPNIRYTNTKSFNHYIEGNYSDYQEKICKNDKMIYEMILGLRTYKGISLTDFYKKYNCNLIDVFDIDSMLKEKLLEIKDDRIFIPYNRWYVMNSILVKFVEV